MRVSDRLDSLTIALPELTRSIALVLANRSRLQAKIKPSRRSKVNAMTVSPEERLQLRHSMDQTKEKLDALSDDRWIAISGLLEGWVETNGSAPILSQTAQAIVNDWILNRLPDRFIALEPKRMAAGDIWCVPVGLAYPNIGIIGQVGEVLVSAFSGGVISATRPEEMKTIAMKCYADREDELKAAFLSTRNA